MREDTTDFKLNTSLIIPVISDHTTIASPSQNVMFICDITYRILAHHCCWHRGKNVPEFLYILLPECFSLSAGHICYYQNLIKNVIITLKDVPYV